MKWMVVAFLAIATAAGANTDNCCRPGTQGIRLNTFCGGTIEAFGEAQYCRVNTCDLIFGIADPTFNERDDKSVPIGPDLGKCPDYTWGFRAGGGYWTADKNMDLHAFYGRIRATNPISLRIGQNSGALWVGLGNSEIGNFAQVTAQGDTPGTADIDTALQWDEIQGQMAGHFQVRAMQLRFFMALQWTQIKVDRHAIFVNPTVDGDGQLIKEFITYDQRTRTWGIGPHMGIDIRQELFCGIGILGHMGMALLVGESEFCRRETSGTLATDAEPKVVEQVLDVPHFSPCALFPAFDSRMGLYYVWQCGNCLTLLFDIGYQFRLYHAVVHPAFYGDESKAGANFPLCDPFIMNGLYIALEVGF